MIIFFILILWIMYHCNIKYQIYFNKYNVMTVHFLVYFWYILPIRDFKIIQFEVIDVRFSLLEQ